MTQGPTENPHREPGPQFQEPDHRDYRLLDQIILARLIAAPSEEVDADAINKIISEVVDTQSAMFAGIGRAMAYLGIGSGLEMTTRIDEVLAYAVFWTEGLATGIYFERARTQRESTP